MCKIGGNLLILTVVIKITQNIEFIKGISNKNLPEDILKWISARFESFQRKVKVLVKKWLER